MRLSPDASSIGAKNTTKARARSASQRLGGRATGGETVCCVTDCPRLVDLGRRRPGAHAARRDASAPCWLRSKPGSSPSPGQTWFRIDKGELARAYWSKIVTE